MDELQISGKRFISSRRAAKDNKYHVDYIGQLIRGGKVAGQKVGRAWYVEADSLAAYFDKEESKGGTTITQEVVESPKVIHAVEKPVVEEIIEEKIIEPVVVVEKEIVEEKKEIEEKEEVHRIPISTHARVSTPTVHTKKHTRLTYITDDEPTLPVVESKKRPKTKVEIKEEEAREVFVQEEKEKEVVRLIPTNDRPAKKSPYIQFGVVAVLGVAAFLVVAGSSYFLTYNAVVARGEMSGTVSLGALNL